MAAPTIYRSSDASAPVLTGTAGDLINLLDKCLVTGYGAQTAAGWTRNTGFAGNTTTRAVFRQGAGNQFYLDVDDRGATSVLTGASGKEAAVRGYEAMTDVGTGTNPFPTTAQVGAAVANWRKSATADALPRGWVLLADDRTFHLAVLNGDLTSTYYMHTFGDFYSLKVGDGFRTCITVRTSVNGSSTSGNFLAAFSNSWAGLSGGFYIARIAAGTGTALSGALLVPGAGFDTSGAFPALDGNVYLSRVLTGDATALSILRGWIRGIYMIAQGVGLNDGDTLVGTGDFAGRSFVVLKGIYQGTQVLLFETTAWDTSS